MSIDALLAGFVDGLLIGFVYGVAAMGLTIIFGVMDVINLAHGPLIAIGMFGVYELFTYLGMNPYLAIILVAIGGLLVGIIVYFTAVHRVIDAPPLSSLLSTFSVNMMIIGVGTAILSTSAYNVNFSLPAVSAGPITVTGNRIAAGLIAILVTALLYGFLYRTRPGKYIRAVANNRQAAELMGIPSTRILALAFGVGTMLAMTAGGLIATILPINILAGGTYELKSFVIVVLGGLGNPLGALIGGLILGLIEGLVPIFLKVTWVPVIEFGLFVLILLVMPQGLFGKKDS
jgi:branched-subunit amino acid ABC-type transport system permease component